MLDTLTTVLEALAIIIAVLAGVAFVQALPNANGAPQEAALAAVALAAAAIPYIVVSHLHHAVMRRALAKMADSQS